LLSVLVAHSYFLRFDEKQRRRAKPYPPLATLQVAALLREADHSVALFDAMLADSVLDYDAVLADTRPQLVVFHEDNYNFLSKMCLGKMRRAACEMIASARRAGARCARLRARFGLSTPGRSSASSDGSDVSSMGRGPVRERLARERASRATAPTSGATASNRGS
jgi:hypothetical protein